MSEDDFKLSNSRVAVVGLGLMGASLALDLRGHCLEIIGASRSPATLEYALDHHIVDRIVEFGPQIDCDLLILAAPVRTIIQQLDLIRKANPKNQSARRIVVLDLGSTKKAIVQSMEALPENYDPLGGHPMCGKEVSGIRQAEKGLYQGKIFVLAPLERTSSKALSLVKELIAVIEAVPLTLSAEKQDELVALTSHLPYLAASALMKTALANDEPQLWNVAASGFRDTTRLAASDLTMMVDILLTNREAILDTITLYQQNLDQLFSYIKDADEEALLEYLTQTKQRRIQLVSQD